MRSAYGMPSGPSPGMFHLVWLFAQLSCFSNLGSPSTHRSPDAIPCPLIQLRQRTDHRLDNSHCIIQFSMCLIRGLAYAPIGLTPPQSKSQDLMSYFQTCFSPAILKLMNMPRVPCGSNTFDSQAYVRKQNLGYACLLI